MAEDRDEIVRIMLNYHRVIRPKDNQFTLEGRETLLIDRDTQTLEHIVRFGSCSRITYKYEIKSGIDALLDSFSSQKLFAEIVGIPDDVIDTPTDTRTYFISIHYRHAKRRVLLSSFDKYGLPVDYPAFADRLLGFFRFYGLRDIFNPDVYATPERRKSDYIYCSVEFDEGYKSYYYIADDDSYAIGDFVIVPVGRENREAIAEIVDIEYFPADRAPFPYEKTKHILRKCAREDMARRSVDDEKEDGEDGEDDKDDDNADNDEDTP